jgi:hypothetical protein
VNDWRDEELERRRPLWAALSTLYLDVELNDDDWRYIARICKESQYSISELEDILAHEVAPVVWGNLLLTAGEWGAFDTRWLESEIVKRDQKKPFWFRVSWLSRFYGFCITSLVQDDWNCVLERLSNQEGSTML